MKKRKDFYDKRNNYITQRFKTPKKCWKYLKTAKYQWQAESVKGHCEASDEPERFFWGKWEVDMWLYSILSRKTEAAERYRNFLASPEADMLFSFGFNFLIYYGDKSIGLTIEASGSKQPPAMECQFDFISGTFEFFKIRCEGYYKFVYDGKIKSLRKHLKNIISMEVKPVYGKIMYWFKPEKCEWFNIPAEFLYARDYYKTKWEKRNLKDKWYRMNISEKQNIKVSRRRVFWDSDYPTTISDDDLKPTKPTKMEVPPIIKNYYIIEK
jgi:hypothetical protein